MAPLNTLNDDNDSLTLPQFSCNSLSAALSYFPKVWHITLARGHGELKLIRLLSFQAGTSSNTTKTHGTFNYYTGLP
jgi:hypothetical protein